MNQEATKVQQDNPLRGVKTYKIIFPIIFGLAVVAFMVWKDYEPGTLTYVQWTWRAAFWLFVALVLMAGRDIGYIWRIRILSDNQLSFVQAFRVIMLWEFTSAITPSAIGGTSVALLYVNKEGISVGRSSAVVMATSFLDELFFLLMFPLLLLMVGPLDLFSIGGEPLTWRNAFLWFAVVGYVLKAAYVLVLSYGFFVNPRGLKWVLLKLFKLPILRRWKQGANQAGTEIIESSKEFRQKPFRYWMKAFLATFVSWCSRYWVANAIMLAFFGVQGHFLIFARQLVMWIMMLVMPTPGGSGFSEYIFTRYLGDFLPVPAAALAGVGAILALLWRLATYYPYLVIGAVIFPRWIKRHFLTHKR